MKNKEIAKQLTEIAELLALSGQENRFRIIAYERAAQALESLPGSIEDAARDGSLENIPGIGSSMAEKIREYLETGKMAALEGLRAKFPQGLLEIMTVTGMGPRKAKVIFDKLKVVSLEELRHAAEAGKIRDLQGFGIKSEQNILKGIDLRVKVKDRALLPEAGLIAREIVGQLRNNRNILEIVPAGSLRRGKETIGDIDILCAVEKGKEDPVVEQFVSLPRVRQVLAKGNTKVSVVMENGLQVDIRLIDPSTYGAALQYFTGSKEHNVALREHARQKGLTVSEYGVFKIGEKDAPIASKTEEDVYKALGMQYIPPPMRENRGEIDAALNHKVPELVERGDIKGDVHVHSRYSDGANKIEELGERARESGYEWIISTDHSQSLRIANGLSAARLREKIKEIRAFNHCSRDVKILCGTEVDILNDGRPDYPDEILEELDFVIASIHGGFKQSEHQITNRIVKALQHPLVDCLGHPTGRLIGRRDSYAVNMDAVLQAARDNGKMLEINASPNRLDLYDYYAKKAGEMGIMIAIGTDSHTLDQFEYMDIGVTWAQRGWLEKKNVFNTLSLTEVEQYLRRRSRI